MIDSHCHLDHEPLFNNLNDVITSSKKNGVEKILTICTTIKSFQNIRKYSDPLHHQCTTSGEPSTWFPLEELV